MFIFFIILLCSGFVQFTKAEEIGRKPAFDFSSAPPRHVFLKDIHSKFHAGRTSLKIVNGQTAARGQFCYQAFMEFTDGLYIWPCGGSLVTSQLILTAAHCVQGAKSATVYLGAVDLSRDEPGRRVIKVSSSDMRLHENYDSSYYYNDIGVVKLPEAVELNRVICTVKLPSCSAQLTADSDNKNNYTVAGWGKTSDSDEKESSKLMYVTVPGEPRNSCTSYYITEMDYEVIESQFCTSGSGGKSICNGDSGGPLVQPDSSGTAIQLGIVSGGFESCELSAPSVFTDVRYFMDWLCPQL